MKATYFLLPVMILVFLCTSCRKPAPNPAGSGKDFAAHIRYSSDDNMPEEWKVYKEMAGFGAYEFRFSEGLRPYAYEIKILTFRDGKQAGAVYFDKSKLSSSFLGSSGRPARFKFYTYSKSDTEEVFRMDPDRQTQYSIVLDVVGDRHRYKWTPLHNDNDSNTNIVANQWYAIATFGQQPHTAADPEKCVYCMLPDYKVHYENWYEKFGIAHYYVVLLRMVQ